MARTIPAILGQRMTRQLAYVPTPCGVRTQQLAERDYRGVSLLHAIWVQPAR